MADQKAQWIERSFRAIQMMTDPQGYARDEIRNAYTEIRHYAKFFLLMALNKDSKDKPDMTQNDFSPEERKRWFGSESVEMKDLTWGRVEALLRPAPVENAVFRVNGALDGSEINEKFGDLRGSGRRLEAVYTPRTVTIYESKEQAMAVAKFLRILTQGSGATIMAEPVKRIGTKETWVVSDNMNLETHNALRLFMGALAQEQSNKKLQETTEAIQQEVNTRLPKGQQWEAWQGVGTLLTLQGRPGVKMYKKLENGKDDPEDVKAVNSLPHQFPPTVIRAVPPKLMAQDGRSLFDPDKLYAVIGHRVLGPKGYALITTGSTRVLGDIVRSELHEEYGRLLKSGSAGDFAGNLSELAVGVVGHPLEKALKAGAATVGSLATLGMITVGTGAHKLACASVGVVRGMGSGAEYRPPRSLVGSVLKRQAHKMAGLNFSHPKLRKDWEFRQSSEAMDIRPDEVRQHMEDALVQDKLVTPLGVLPNNDVLAHQWIKRISSDKEAKAFVQYMRDNKLYPDLAVISADGKYPFPGNELPAHTQDAIDALAERYAKWVFKVQSLRVDMAKVLGDGDSAISVELTDAMNAFDRDLRKIHALPGNTSNRIKEVVRNAITEGMQGFLLTELSKPVSATQMAV